MLSMSASHRLAYSSKNRALRTAILHLCADVQPDSPGREVVALASLTQRSGWRALIASSGGRLVQDAERSAVRHIAVPFHRQGIISRWRSHIQVRALARKERPALIHAHGLATAPYALAVGREERLPVVLDITQPIQADARGRKIFEVFKRSSALLRVPSSFVATQIQKDFGLDSTRIHCVPAGIDLHTYSARFISPERLQALSQLWRLPELASLLLVPMSFTSEQGHKIFLQALAKIKDENVFAVLAGRNSCVPAERAEIEALIGSLRLHGKIIMPDYCFDLPAACWLSSVVVAPNITPRGQNVELLAAQAIGRPVIVTDTGANREMVLNGETAWIVPPNNVDTLAEALRQAVRMNSDQRVNLADHAHNFIADNFPQNAWFDGVMRMYESLLQPSARMNQAA